MFNSLFLALLAVFVFGASGAVGEDGGRFNLLFIAVDDLRPELGCYGNPTVKSPHIDALASRGTVFSRAYCQQAVCSPSRSSLMTGRYPDATRVWDLKTHFREALPEVVTLPQYFKLNGYQCVSLGKIYHRGYEDGRSWSEPAWFASGLMVDTATEDYTKRSVQRFGPGVSEYSGDAEDSDGTGRGTRERRPRPAFEMSAKSDDELPDGATAAEAIRRLRDLKSGRKPFFLAVGFIKPHLPFVAPRKYWDLYDPAEIPVPAIDQLPDGAPPFSGHNNGELHNYSNIPEGDPIPEDVARQLRHGYYAAVSYVDAQVGRLLEALKREGLGDNTVVVLWGDHGWQLGDHGLWAKHTNFELATRSPLIISVPGQQVINTVCSSPVEFVDVYPTLTDACGLKTPRGLDGVNLMTLLADPAASVRSFALSQYPRGGAGATKSPLMGYSLRDERWRLTLWRDRHDGSIVATELYDEENDPAETRNLAQQHPEVVKRLTACCPDLPEFTIAPTARTRDHGSRKSSAMPRDELFDRKDRNADGRLGSEEFLANQQDVHAAQARFEKWDTDQDGALTEAEFVSMGPKRKPQGTNQ